MMVTIALLAVLATLAVPAWTTLVNSSRLATTANNLVAALQLARTEAVKCNADVQFSRADGAGNGSWQSWQVALPSAAPAASACGGAGTVLHDGSVKPPVQLTGGSAVTFKADGLAYAGSGQDQLANLTFTVCIATTRPAQNQRVVQLASGSRISVASASGTNGGCP